MAARGNPKAISLGPGYLYIAALGSTEPSDLITAWDTAWTLLGYTEEGSEFSYEPSTDDVDVAEELDIIDVATTGRSISVSFTLAELTAENLKRAMNGGTLTTGGIAPDTFQAFEPPVLGSETYTMLGFEAEDHEERWLFRNCRQTGNVQIQRRKGADKATIPTEWRCLKGALGENPFAAVISDARKAA